VKSLEFWVKELIESVDAELDGPEISGVVEVEVAEAAESSSCSLRAYSASSRSRFALISAALWADSSSLKMSSSSLYSLLVVLERKHDKRRVGKE
jgi:hypothetical protein